MLPCSEVTRLCATEEVESAPILRRLSVRLHLMMCDQCHRYVRELKLIGAAARAEARRLFGDPAELETLEGKIRERMRAEFRDRKEPWA